GGFPSPTLVAGTSISGSGTVVPAMSAQLGAGVSGTTSSSDGAPSIGLTVAASTGAPISATFATGASPGAPVAIISAKNTLDGALAGSTNNDGGSGTGRIDNVVTSAAAAGSIGVDDNLALFLSPNRNAVEYAALAVPSGADSNLGSTQSAPPDEPLISTPDDEAALAAFLASDIVTKPAPDACRDESSGLPCNGTSAATNVIRVVNSFEDSAKRECRMYQQVVQIGGASVQADAVVCKDRGGDWQVVPPNFARGPL